MKYQCVGDTPKAGVMTPGVAAHLRQASAHLPALPAVSVASPGRAPKQTPSRRPRSFRRRFRYNRKAAAELQLSLFDDLELDTVLDEPPPPVMPVQLELPGLMPAPAEAAEEPVAFSDEEIIALHDGLLLSSLLTIRKHPGSPAALEAMSWVCGADRPLRPFSFRACCSFAGLDHEALREGVIEIWEAMMKGRKLPDIDASVVLSDNALKRRQMLRALCDAIQDAVGPLS